MWAIGVFRCAGQGGKPDVSFIRVGRLKPDLMEGHVPIPPDLAVEVVSPNDYFREVQDKVGEYLRAGVRLVWVLEPSSRTILVYWADGTGETLNESGRLSGEAVLPGFSRPALDFFESAVQPAT